MAKPNHQAPLAKEPAWTNFLTRQRETVLHLLAAYERPGWADGQSVERLFEILELHTAHSHTNIYGELALHRAAATGSMEEAFDAMGSARNELLNPGTLSPHARDKFGRSLVFHAACGGNVSVIRKLVRLGASPNSADEHGRSPLHAAVMAAQASAVKALREAGAAVNSVTRIDGLTSLHLACLYGFEDCVAELLKEYEPNMGVSSISAGKFSAGGAHGCFHALHVAVGNGHTGCVAKLLEHDSTLLGWPGEGYIRLKDSKTGTLKEGQLVVLETPLRALEIAVLLGKPEISSQIDGKMESSSTASLQERIEALLSHSQ